MIEPGFPAVGPSDSTRPEELVRWQVLDLRPEELVRWQVCDLRPDPGSPTVGGPWFVIPPQ